MSLPKDYRITSRGEPIENVYFLNSGIISVHVPSARSDNFVVGMIGYEGLAPWTFTNRAACSPFDMVMHFPGDGFRIKLTNFMSAVEDDPVIADVVRRFSSVFQLQMAYAAQSNAVDTVDIRLARWLLMCRDRIWGSDIKVTHEILGQTLALRRPSITTAFHSLEGRHLVRSSRGVFSIRDRRALKKFVGRSYGAPEREYFSLVNDYLIGESEHAAAYARLSEFGAGSDTVDRSR
ncbi:Crp/Fnr family transcriptional regulator [Agrobacterium sp. SORGH_AS 787]|uniref:Crp/Fnr family transcriptional regulator n=1 Tax=Agrobacterium sp. SORGH_AS 787 TaxID=3041775 RepID=UPI00277E6C98|nr:CRP-like cAMP-binding protein [Rhizobium sp. SORGH_AS_0787]